MNLSVCVFMCVLFYLQKTEHFHLKLRELSLHFWMEQPDRVCVHVCDRETDSSLCRRVEEDVLSLKNTQCQSRTGKALGREQVCACQCVFIHVCSSTFHTCMCVGCCLCVRGACTQIPRLTQTYLCLCSPVNTLQSAATVCVQMCAHVCVRARPRICEYKHET